MVGKRPRFDMAIYALVLTSVLLATLGIAHSSFAAALVSLPPEIEPFTTVNSADDADDGTCDQTHCSLREAINAVSAPHVVPGVTIDFNIPGDGPHTIQPTSPLPAIFGLNVIIDGYTQTGASPNSDGLGLGLNTVLKIELDGTEAGHGTNGLVINSGSTFAGGSTIRGLAINRFRGSGVLVRGDGNVIEGNFIGTDVTGQLSVSNRGPGVSIDASMGPTQSNVVLSNSIYSNVELGINLRSGANNAQHFPVLTSAISQGGSATIQGALSSFRGLNFRLEFFSNEECDPSGQGEGEAFLGFTFVTMPSDPGLGVDFAESYGVDIPAGSLITATATDPFGSTSEFSQCVQVPDTTPPLVTVPDNITLDGDVTGGADKGNIAIVPFLESAKATDVFDPSPVIINDAPDVFQLGDTVVTFTATDVGGNQATGQATVTVVDTTPPLITLPGSISLEAEVSGGVDKVSLAIQTFLDTATAVDIVDSNWSIVDDAPDVFPLGDTVVTFRAVDASGNQAKGKATVTVVDTTPPLITFPPSITLESEVPGEVDKRSPAIQTFLNAATASDVVDSNPMVVNDAPDTFPLGATVVTFTATDASGNQATGQATVTVVDITPPLITLPPSITVEGDVTGGVDRGNTFIVTFLGDTEATDVFDPSPVMINDTPDVLPLGETVVTFTATDASGNQATSRAVITVADTTPPIITLPESITVEVGVSGAVDRGNAAVEVFLNAVKATGVVDPNPTIVNDLPDVLPLSDTVVTFTVTDASGNQATITVVDVTPTPTPTSAHTPTSTPPPTPTPGSALSVTPTPTGQPRPTPTPDPTITATETPTSAPSNRGGCTTGTGGSDTVEASWVLLALSLPGLSLSGLRKWWPCRKRP